MKLDKQDVRILHGLSDFLCPVTVWDYRECGGEVVHYFCRGQKFHYCPRESCVKKCVIREEGEFGTRVEVIFML